MKEPKPRRNWKALEIVDGKTEPVEPEVSDALQAAADAPQPPEAEEVIAAQPEITITVRVEPMKVERLEQARALAEIANPSANGLRPPSDGIQSFKDSDGRTMNVVACHGVLFKTPFNRQEN